MVGRNGIVFSGYKSHERQRNMEEGGLQEEEKKKSKTGGEKPSINRGQITESNLEHRGGGGEETEPRLKSTDQKLTSQTQSQQEDKTETETRGKQGGLDRNPEERNRSRALAGHPSRLLLLKQRRKPDKKNSGEGRGSRINRERLRGGGTSRKNQNRREKGRRQSGNDERDLHLCFRQHLNQVSLLCTPAL
jgi:hypothetical protein